MKKLITTVIFSLLIVFQAAPQQYLEREFKGYTNPNELVTLSANLPFSQAIELLSKVSETTTGKKIVSTVNIDKPIGIEINNMPYDKALVVLVQYQDLTYEEKEDVIIVKRKDEGVKRTPETYAPPDVREVKISAVFFELDVNATRQRGIDWQLLLSGRGVDFGGTLVNQGLNSNNTGTGTGTGTGTTNTSTQAQPNFNLTGSGTFQSGNFFGEATAMFQFFENENLGEIIASPNIIVRDGNQGRIQVGTDFDVKQRDFAGNVIDKFFPTGTIIEVTPYVYNEDSLNYILLNISAERSSFQASEITTQINKTSAQTQIVMLNGEETILGGLFVNEQQKVRTGIPFLKDLPWWFFGIRYLTGSDQTVTTKKELLILIKTDLIPTLRERMENPQANNLIRDELKQNRQRIKYYQLNSTNQ
jgi:type II secretory pathway component HofQ